MLTVARIRTIKPEAFTSESLAEVNLAAERTFFGLLTQADDHGRFRDNAAIIAGLLWPLRAEHTAVHVEEDLHQLADAGLICRYTGCDGRRYLHIVTWHAHQKIDKASQSRAAACLEHCGTERCGICQGTCGAVGEPSGSPRRGFPEDSVNPRPAAGRSSGNSATMPDASPVRDAAQQKKNDGASGRAKRAAKRTAGRTPIAEPSTRAPRTLPEESVPGSRILDPGSSIPSGRTAPELDASARDLIGEYVAACTERPPADVLGHLGRIAKKLLDEGVAAEHIRGGLQLFAANPKHPSVLTSMVNEAMNGGTPGLVRPNSRPNLPAHRAWSNPADPATAYAEEL